MRRLSGLAPFAALALVFAICCAATTALASSSAPAINVLLNGSSIRDTGNTNFSVPYAFPGSRDFFSSRIGCQTFAPAYGIDLGKLCLK